MLWQDRVKCDRGECKQLDDNRQGSCVLSDPDIRTYLIKKEISNEKSIFPMVIMNKKS